MITGQKRSKFAARLLALAMTMTLLFSAGISAQAATYYSGTATTTVNLREAPSTKAGKVGTLQKGDEVVLVASVKEGNVVNGYTADVAFYKLSTGEYVAAKYITPGDAVESDEADSAGGEDDEVDMGGDDDVSMDADADGETLSEIDLETGEVSEVDGVDLGADDDDLESGDDLEDASDESLEDDSALADDSDDEVETQDSGSNAVSGTVTADALKVRVSPSMSATVIKKLDKGASITLTQSIADGSTHNGSKVSGNWYKLDSGGFVAAAFVKVSGTVSSASSSASTTTTTSYRVGTATANTTMYSKPMELAEEKGTMKKGESMRVSSSHGDGSTVSGMKVTGNWYKLSNGYYVKADTISLSTKTETSGSSLATGTTLAAGDTAKATTKLNVRSGPGTSYKKQSSLSKGAEVTIEEIVESGASYDDKTVKGSWAKLSDGGFVSVGYLEKTGSTASVEDGADSGEAALTQEELDAALPEEE